MKVLFDTSCVFGVVMPSADKELSRQLPEAGKACVYYTSQYLRMEFMRTLVLTGIEIYTLARRVGDLFEAQTVYANKFGRAAKFLAILQARFTQHVLREPPNEPIERWGWLILQLAMTFDQKFANNYVRPKTGCKRGQLSFTESLPTMDRVLRDFYIGFKNYRPACRTKEVLLRDTDAPTHDPGKILEADESQFHGKVRTSLKKTKKKLSAFFYSLQRTELNCDRCARIGDVLIALEQPKSWDLHHTDYSFDALCPLLKKKHTRVMVSKTPAVE